MSKRRTPPLIPLGFLMAYTVSLRILAPQTKATDDLKLALKTPSCAHRHWPQMLPMPRPSHGRLYLECVVRGSVAAPNHACSGPEDKNFGIERF